MDNCNVLFRNARWIGSKRRISTRNNVVNHPTPSLRAIKRISLDKKPSSATVRVSGLGAFVLYVNGKRVSDEILSPAFTNYRETVLFCEYNVAEFLREGENSVAIEVGAGFFNQTTDDRWSFSHAPWYDAEKFILTMSADKEEILVSDPSWRVNHNGPRYHTAIRQGEYYDATREDGWLEDDFDPAAWENAILTSPPGGILKKQELPPIRICEILRPVSKKQGKNGVIFDFGKNISGVCRIKMAAPHGTEICIHYGEQLNADADAVSKYGIDLLVNCENQYMDKYIFRGDGVEEFNAEFVYHGFQFAEVIGADPAMDEIEALFIHTDLREKGTWNSSDEMFNWIVDAGNTSILSNFHGFSEDCPHREKNGWTGDAVITVHNAVYRYDMKKAYEKWICGDLVDSQLHTGQLSCVVPTGGWGYVWGCGPAWDTALFSIPEAYYRETGDADLLISVFDAAEKYLEYARLYEDEDGLVCFGLGDWCPPTDHTGNKIPVISNEFSDCCQYINMLRIMQLICKIKGEPARADVYKAREERVLASTRRKYVREGDVDNSTVSARAIALYYGIVEGENAQVIADKLAEQVKASGYRAGAGILGMKAIFTALSETGHIDVVNKLVHCDEYPSYGFWKKNGATSLWESWFTNTHSRNHHMYSEVLNWIYRYVGGIRNDGIAYDKASIKPYLFANECSAESSTETPRGVIGVKWSYVDGVFRAECEIPEGTDAVLEVGNEKRSLPVGKSSVEFKI